MESPSGYRVVLVRRGRFRRRAAGVAADVDATLAYVGVPGEEEHFAHPAGGDVCTLLSLTPALWCSLAGDSARVTRSSVYVDGRLDLAHRRVLAAAHDRDIDYAVTDQLMTVLGHVVAQAVGTTPGGALPSPADRALAAAAREAIGAGHPAASGLTTLAALLDVSPFRLSRAFTREMGVSLTRYRNRVRVSAALDRLEQGESSFGALAADLGFADQAHLCRTMAQHLGNTPTAVRGLLAPRAGGTAWNADRSWPTSLGTCAHSTPGSSRTS